MARVSNRPVVYFKARSCDLFFTRGTYFLVKKVHQHTKLGFSTVQV